VDFLIKNRLMDYSLFLVKFTKNLVDIEDIETSFTHLSLKKKIGVEDVEVEEIEEDEEEKVMIPVPRMTQMNHDRAVFSKELNYQRMGTQVNNSAVRLSLMSNNTIKRSNVKRNGKKVTEFKLIKNDVLIE